MTSRSTFVGSVCALALLLGASMPRPSIAQETLRRGDVEVYASAVPTLELAPEIAQRYAITRSATRGLLSVVVLRDAADGQHAIEAVVSGTATAADGKPQALALRLVRDGSAISYLAEPRIADGARIDFTLSVTPAGSDRPIQIRFAQEFFAPR